MVDFEYSGVADSDKMQFDCSGCSVTIRAHAMDPQSGTILECPQCGHEMRPGALEPDNHD
jgi:DNA-directed RNA polymerase subunit RPC12/RpoP